MQLEFSLRDLQGRRKELTLESSCLLSTYMPQAAHTHPCHTHTHVHTESNACDEKNITQQSRFKLIHTSVCVIHKLPAEGKKLSTEQPALLFCCVKFWDRQEEAEAGWLWRKGHEPSPEASLGFCYTSVPIRPSPADRGTAQTANGT